MASFTTPEDQQIYDGSIIPQLIIGASVSGTANVKQNWSAETFGGLIGKSGLSIPVPTGGDLGAGVAVNFGFNKDEAVIGVGVGAGVKISFLNVSVLESISVTDAEADEIGDLSGGIGNEPWIIDEVNFVEDSDGGYYTGYIYTKTISEIDSPWPTKACSTGIQVYSKAIDGIPTNVWQTKAYQEESKKAEAENE